MHIRSPEEIRIMRARSVPLSLAILVLVLAFAAAGCSSQETASPEETGAATGATYETVDVQTTYDALGSNADAQIVDVREPVEWAETGVPEGAALIPLGDLGSAAASELATDQPVYVICRSGNRSRTGSDILVGLGYTQVYNVDGGITAWLNAGLPVETYTP
jgi:rhodanese-related sulfurtransferase